MQKRWKSAWILMLSFFMIVLTACGSSGGSKEAAAPEKPKNDQNQAGQAKGFDWKQFSGKEIKLLANKQPWTVQLEPHLKEFEQLTGMKVKVLQYPEDQLRQKMLISLQAKSNDFDVYMSLKSREGLQYYNAGFYENLDSYLSNPKLTSPDYDIKDFFEGPLNGEKINGNLVGLPINVEGSVIFYNKEIFDKYGIEVPKSLEDIETAAKKVKEASNGQVYGVTLRGAPGALPYTFGNFIYNYGKTWLDDGKPNFEEPTRLKALQLYADLAKNYGPPGVVQYSFYQSTALFNQGKVAMMIESSNELSTVIDPKNSYVVDKVNVIPFPAGPGGSHLTQLQWGISMNKFSENKEPAWLFMQWATSKDLQTKMALAGIASPRSSTWDDAKFKQTIETPTKKQWAEALKFTLAHGNPDVGPPAEDQAQVRQIVGEMVDKVILGQMSAEDAAKEADKRLTEVLNKK